MLRRVEKKIFIAITGRGSLRVGIYKNTKSGKFYVYQMKKGRRIGSRLNKGVKGLASAKKIARRIALNHGFAEKKVVELSRKIMRKRR